MKLYFYILFICFSICKTASAQVIESFADNQPEKLFIHKNASVLLTGEYLYFTVYNLQAASNLPSTLSKIAYVKLINKENNVVLKTKITLVNGMGQGDFFLPTSVKTGAYKMIVYTNWMLNNNLKTYNQSDIIIINPYLAQQFLGGNESNKKDTVISKPYATGITVKTDKLVYGTREKVIVSINPTIKKNELLKISFSVRKIDSLDLVYNASDNATSFINNTYAEKLKIPLKFNPENNGFSIEGKVINKTSNRPESFKDLAMSVVGKTPFFNLIKSQFDGSFNVSFNKHIAGNEALIQVLEQDNFTPDDAKITMIEKQSPELKSIKFPDFKISPNLKKTIENRSIYNQIESNYFSVKPDSVLTPLPQKPFYQEESGKLFKLDDYKRFATLRETFIEVVDPVYVRKSKGKSTFYIKSTTDDYLYQHLKPLVLVDGVVVQAYDWVLDLNAYRVDAIWVINKKITLGAKDFKGVIAIETKKQDINFTAVIPYLNAFPIEKPALPKKYFRQVYNEENREKTKRIPDYRIQLMWQPRIYIKEKEIKIPVYTSDVTGIYKIQIEGFSESGKPISATGYFEVK